ncbi:uncharacterized protein HMPREF1541_08290 [Cyphellophora europaea CBS 101466]|uniref:Uncharacterized protein n=1 Tax=Cyphellophora europaea (strain CBS 101466) TaxID=1220924 RepID=W2RNJ0_CYPE1|nr:uncharacterized protein HMPREF1541_08290 [Cyphellophora europaea CBS 101466]ETN37299.1 hypothetical protein HMPREF1541_08290 [Cyphellophora europaea CBS 101466]
MGVVSRHDGVHGQEPHQPSAKAECSNTTTTVTLTQYGATVTSTLGHSTTPSTSTKTISLLPSGLITLHNATLPLNNTVTTPTPSFTSHTSSSTISAATASPTPAPPSDPSHQAGRVAGGVIGGLAGLALLVFLLAWCCKRRNQLKVRLRCRRDTKEEKELARQAEVRQRADLERKKALQSLEAKPGGGLLHSGLMAFNLEQNGSQPVSNSAVPPTPPSVPVKGTGPGRRFYA